MSRCPGSGGGLPLPRACTQGLTWRQCRAAARPRARARGRGSSPPHRRRWPAARALQHRGRAWGAAPGSPTPAPRRAGGPSRGVTLLSHLTGGGPHPAAEEHRLHATLLPEHVPSPSSQAPALTDALQLLLGAALQDQQPQLLRCSPVRVGACPRGLRALGQQLAGDADGRWGRPPVQLHAPAQGGLLGAVHTPGAGRGQAQLPGAHCPGAQAGGRSPGGCARHHTQTGNI